MIQNQTPGLSISKILSPVGTWVISTLHASQTHYTFHSTAFIRQTLVTLLLFKNASQRPNVVLRVQISSISNSFNIKTLRNLSVTVIQCCNVTGSGGNTQTQYLRVQILKCKILQETFSIKAPSAVLPFILFY